jgi:hypothetical protein
MRGLVAVLVVTFSAVSFARAPAQTTAQASGAISGVVVDATTKQPVRNALVELGGPTRGGRLTDGRGRFIFLHLAPGNYTLRVRKPGYFEPIFFLVSPYKLSLDAAQWRANERLELMREGSISGAVLDERGEPVVGANVRVFAEVSIAGRVRLATGPGAATDDRGAYRVAGLTQGRYVVVVSSVQQAVPADTPALVIAGQSVAQAAKNAGAPVAERPAVEFAGGQRLVLGSAVTPPPPDSSGRPQAYAITFYPNSFTLAGSTAVELGGGEQRGGIDFQLRPVPTFRIEGRIDGPPSVAAGMPLRLLQAGAEDLGAGSEAATTLVAADGRFTFLNVPAGRYTLDARPSSVEYEYPRGLSSTPSSARWAPTPGRPVMGGSSGPLEGAPLGTSYSHRRGDWDQTAWIRTEVAVGDRDITDMSVPLQRAGRISGRIEWDRTTPAAPKPVAAAGTPRSQDEARIAALNAAMSKTTIRAEPADGSPWLGLPAGTVSPDNSFVIEGLLPGPYLIRVNPPARGGPASVKSIVWKGADHTFTPFDASSGLDAVGVVLTLTDKTQSIRGTVSGIPADQRAAVIAFSVDPGRWVNYGLVPGLIRSGTTANDRTYQLTLPAGDFYLVAVDESLTSAWSDPAFLKAAEPLATRVSLASGETKSQDLRLSEVKR